MQLNFVQLSDTLSLNLQILSKSLAGATLFEQYPGDEYCDKLNN